MDTRMNQSHFSFSVLCAVRSSVRISISLDAERIYLLPLRIMQ